MKVVVDTNIIFSALYNYKSDAGQLMLAGIEKKIDLFAPEHVQDELKRILIDKLDYSMRETNETIKSLPIKWVDKEIYKDAERYAERCLKDEKDIPILACALALDADIVSGDKHLLSVKEGIAKAWRLKELIRKIEVI